MPAATMLVCAALLLITAFIYAQTAHFPFITYDDPAYASANPHVLAGLSHDGIRWAFTTTICSNWHPLTWLSLQLDAQFFGAWPGGFHLVNALLHALNCTLLFFWLRGMRKNAADQTFAPAAIAALLFAAHPLHVESVAWVTERKDTLSTLFFFLTLLAYTRYAQSTRRHAVFYLLALALYALGLMTKPMLVTLPALLLLLDFWPLRRLRFDRRAGWLLLEKAPFAALAAASCVVTILVQHNAEVPLESYPVRWRIVNAVVAYGRYLQKTVWPLDLALPYPFDARVPWMSFICSAAALIFLTALTAWQWRRRPYLLVGWLWFGLTLVPVIGLVQVGSQAMADRYSYLPHIGLFGALGFLFWNAVKSLRARAFFIAAATLQIAGCIIVAAFAWQARVQCAFWRDSITLFEHTREAYGSNHLLDRILAESYLAVDDLDSAIPSLRRALLIQPNDPESLGELGVALARTGYGEAARSALARALELRPGDVEVRLNFARLLHGLGDHTAAIAQFEETLARDPGCAEALASLASLLTISPDLAEHDATRALALAERLRTLDGGKHALAALDCLAAAHAELAQWPAAEAAAMAALDQSRAGGLTPEVIARRAERLARIRDRQPIRE